MGRHTIGPASSGLGEGLAGRDVLVARCRVFRLTLVRLASGFSGHCVKKQCGLAELCFGGHMALDLRLSRVHRGVAAMGQDH